MVEMKRLIIIQIVLWLVVSCNCRIVFAHCDTMDGPVVADARKAIENNNVNYVLKWVLKDNEQAIRDAFYLMMKVRVLSPEAEKLSEKYFFETLVRLHRSGEGVPYTGLLPSGTPVDEKILAADKSIELGNLSPLENLVPKANMPELKERFEKVMSLKNFDVNNVQAGREYIESYVQFFHYAEGEHRGHNHEQNEVKNHDQYLENEVSQPDPIPWVLCGIFFITSLLFSILYFRNK